jgi:CcmD family protein
MEEFLSSNQLYIVLGVVLLVWVGIAGFLLRLEKRLTKLEHRMKKE